MFQRFRLLPLLLIVALVGWTGPLHADDAAGKKPEPRKEATGKYLRLKMDKKGNPIALQTAIVRFVPDKGDNKLEVDLVSVVHIADEDYYDQLNEELAKYDVVLYELVAPEGTRVPKGGPKQNNNPLALIQNLTSQVLGLEHQTKHIDYTKPNFIHADMSPKQMAEAMAKRGDNQLTLILSIMADLMRQENLREMKRKNNPQGKGLDLDLLTLFDPMKMKRMLAEQLVEMDETGGLGPTINTILVKDRNAACMKVFQKELAKGRKKIAIFYGAAHMPDFEQRLREDFGLRRHREVWLDAWSLRGGSGLGGLLDLLDKLSK